MKRTDKETELKIINLYNKGFSFIKIGKEMSINSVTAFNILKRNGITTRTNGGIYHLNEKEIINDYKHGVKIVDIAKKYNVNAKTIYNYLEKYNIKRDYIYINRNLRRDYFKNIDSYDKAYFLGFLITDGCVSEDNSVRLQLNFQDSYILETFREKTNNENSIKIAGSNRNHECAWHCKSKEMQEDLKKYGVVFRKSTITKFPILENKKMMSHLIRGLFDGDGWITCSVGHTIGICSSSKEFIIDLKKYLVDNLKVYDVKINSNEHRKHENYCTLYQISWSSLNDIIKIGDFIYQDKADCYLKRKYEKFCKIKDKIHDNTETIS